MVELGLPDLGHPVVDAGIDDRVPGKLIDVVIEVGEEDEEHLDQFLDREFIHFFCFIL